MRIYIKAFVFKPISNKLNTLVGCDVSFTKSSSTFEVNR